jgi:cysteine-rich repeat protein
LALLAGLAPSPLFASFHDIKVVQIFGRTQTNLDAQYVMLQMWFAGQNLVGGQSGRIYNGDGSLAATFTFPAAVANGADQATLLIGTAEAATLFGVAMDLVVPHTDTTGNGVKICWEPSLNPPSCVAFGDYTGDSADTGTPFKMGDFRGLALTRRLDICGAATTLDSCDDTANSANDFILTLPSPKNNSGASGTLPASTCGNGAVEGLEGCDDSNTADGDGCSSKCQFEPPSDATRGLAVDPSVSASADGNGVFEPGETAVVAPTWKNISSSDVTLAGAATAFTGNSGTYTIAHGLADYGTLSPGSAGNCLAAGCYQLKVSDLKIGAPIPRPTHWDATFDEVIGRERKTWTLHIGDSFSDVPRSQLFYRKIETLLHNGITAGCTTTTYCPDETVARSQMAIFIAKGIAGGGPNVPVSGTLGSSSYNCTAGGVSLFTDVLPTDIFCKHVHYIASQNVTLGCATNQYCPTGTVSRLEMAAFIAKAVVAPGGGAALPMAYGPDPVTTFSYDCRVATALTHFTDVPATNTFCKHVHYLWAKGIIGGCSTTEYCPTDPVTRDAMAKFLTNAFALRLYGP